MQSSYIKTGDTSATALPLESGSLQEGRIRNITVILIIFFTLEEELNLEGLVESEL